MAFMFNLLLLQGFKSVRGGHDASLQPEWKGTQWQGVAVVRVAQKLILQIDKRDAGGGLTPVSEELTNSP